MLPSATEIVYALGLDEALAGVTFECDHPAGARTKPVVSGTALPTDGSLSASEIDAAVSATVATGEPIYTLDADRIRQIAPDLILAQDLCEVCAVPSGAIQDALDVLGCQAEVVSLDPTTLDEVIDCLGVVASVTGTERRGQEITATLRVRLDDVHRAVEGRRRPRVLALEWSDPPFGGGHWVPDMIAVAGGEPVLATSGERSPRLDWDTIAVAAIDAVVFMPCGYDLDAAVAEGTTLLELPALAAVPRLWAVDATAYFSRPGPRVVDGVELLAAILHPDAGVVAPPRSAAGLRGSDVGG